MIIQRSNHFNYKVDSIFRLYDGLADLWLDNPKISLIVDLWYAHRVNFT